MTLPIGATSPIEHAGPLPASADCVVIGGGIIGVMTAYHLALAGLRAVVLEKGRIAGEQSQRNWGWIRQQGRDPAEIPIMAEANGMWRDLEAQTKGALGLRQTGVLYLGRTEADLAGYKAWLPHAAAHKLDSAMLTSDQVAAMMPDAARRWAGGLWTASDMRAEPWVAVPTLARLAVAAGVTIIEDCAARGFDIEAGRIAGVVTEKGRIRTAEVVIAGGAWSALLLRRHGIGIPQLSVRATVAATEPVAEVFAGGAADQGLAWRRRADGGYTLAPSRFHEFYLGPDAFRAFRDYVPQLRAEPFGTRFLPAAPKGYPDAWGTARRWSLDEASPFERCRILNPAANRRKAAGLAAEFSKRFPSLGAVRLRAVWAGMIDTMPDEVPVVDRLAEIGGLTIATGMSGHGFGIGPAFGRIAAALVQGRETGHDLNSFRFSRFRDGSGLKPGLHM